jgi:hypothetical protein
MKLILSFLILIFSLSSTFSQNVIIAGKIIDNKSSQPMPYASVTVGSAINTTSDNNGNFSLKL